MATEHINNLMLSVLSDEATEKEKLELEDWLNQSPDHMVEFKRLAAFFTQPAPIGEMDVETAWLKVKQSTIDKKKKVLLSIRHWFTYAAMLTIVVATGFYFFNQSAKKATLSLAEMKKPMLVLENGEKIILDDQSFSMQKEGVTISNNTKDNLLSYQQKNATDQTSKNQLNHLFTPIGETYKIELSDGTRVTLNAMSELIYPTGFCKENREVTLKGEGFFEVAKDPSRPFIVHTDQLSVQVLGTTFNVSCYTSDPTTRTTLVEGSVKVHQGTDRQIITPSQQYVYNKKTGERCINNVNTADYIAWLNHESIFKNATLEEILSRLQLWYPLSVNYENEQVKRLHFSLKIDKNTSLDQIIELINYTNEVKIEKVNPNSINVKTN